MYYIWSTRNAGWYLTSGNYGSDRKAARTFQYDDAIALAAKHHMMHGHEFGVLVIAASTLNDITRKANA